jgi:hypothetical protein
MGFAGNYEPQFIVPRCALMLAVQPSAAHAHECLTSFCSLIANVVDQKGVKKSDVQDMDFFIGTRFLCVFSVLCSDGNQANHKTLAHPVVLRVTGNEAAVPRHNYNVDMPIRHGIVENWDNMEK